jgi:hypothetical protein
MSVTVNLPVRAARAVARRTRYIRSGTLKRIPVNLITNEFAFSFAPDGWNYFCALVAEYEKNPRVRPEDTTFFRFFRDERVKSVGYLNDVLFLHQPERRQAGFKFHLGTYPWGDHVGGGPWGHQFDRVEGRDTRDLYGYRANLWYEPGDTHALELEWQQMNRVCERMRMGYRPLREGQLPEVTLLVRRDGDYRAVRYNGQHRLAVLSRSERRHVAVLIPSATSINTELAMWPSASRLPKVVHDGEIVVREADVDSWHYVKSGQCSREQALEIFHAFFELNGRERINYLGLPPGY